MKKRQITEERLIRFWLAMTPALPEPTAKAARAKVGERYEAFITALRRRLAQGVMLCQEVPTMYKKLIEQTRRDVASVGLGV